MGFHKVARVESLGAFQVGADGTVTKTAADLGDRADQARRSYYLDGSAKIPVKETLSKIAEQYAISADPSDYIYEAIRANTVNVPNDNHDGFHRDELLRYDNQLKTAVYLTYREKPHHVNHRTENAKTARGVILDSHYNDDAPPLDNCPTCDTKTAERTNRDASGLHCIACNTTVKDEFVEILVAIDTKKDPVFAEGVRTGQLKAGSMGCNCTSTTCNVCGHVARSRSEFCDHIRSGNKGTIWTRAAGKWKKTTPSEANREFQKRGMKFNATDLVSQTASDGFSVRKSFEYCLGVEFDEYSRVDQPADPKALQREVLSKSANYVPSTSELSMESEQLIARARRNQRCASRKEAMKFYVVRVDGDPMDTYAAETPEQAKELAQPDPQSQIEVAEIEADDAGAARLMANESTEWQPMDAMPQDGGDVTINVDSEPPAGADPNVDVSQDPMDQTMEDFTEDQLAPNEPAAPAEEMSPEEMGVIPPGASVEAEGQEQRSASMSTFADAYRGWKVQVSAKGNALLVNPDEKPVLVFTASAAPKSDEDRRAFGREIITHLWEHGLTRTAKRYNSLFPAKFAQVVDHAMDDMKDFADKYTKSDVAGGGDNDMAGVDGGSAASTDTRESNDDDMADSKTVQVQDSQQDRATDMEGADDNAPDSSLSDRDSDMRDDPRKEINVGSDSALDDPTTDHTERLAALVGKQVKCAEVEGAWLVSGFDKSAQKFVLTNSDLEMREVEGDAMLSMWKQLDQGPDSAVGTKAAEKLEERIKKVYATKLEEAKRAHAEALVATRKTAIEDHQRAIRVVAKRHALNVEQSPLKEALGITLSNARTAGYDALTSAPLEYVPLHSDLAVHLIEAAWKDGGDAEITRLLDRAAELMEKNSDYLKSAEEDLSQMPIKIPPVTAASVANEVDREAETLRREASAGNMELASVDDTPVPMNGRESRTRIQAAINSGTRVGARMSQYRR